MRKAPILALVVPFYNEERHLPRLIASLRNQDAKDIPVVFINNASTDNSAALVRRCEEVKTGAWICLEEERVGKFHAMKTATSFCVERLGVRYIGFLDADSCCADSAWVGNGAAIVGGAERHFGYTYSPLVYFGFEQLPIFAAAYRAYERVQRFLIQNVGWLANGNGFVCSADILRRYFRRAQVTTEFDLRCSLLALSDGLRGYLNPSLVMTSGRRIVVNARNFAAWCFYDRDFYSKKDINARVKLDLDAPAHVEDLRPEMVGRFFERRALKLTCRHLIPLAIFDRRSSTLERINDVLGVDGTEQIVRARGRFGWNGDCLLTDRFEAVIRMIESHPVSAVLSNRVANLMRDHHDEIAPPLLSGPPVDGHKSGGGLVKAEVR